MNMSFRARMSTLHTWTGLLLGWVLYFMFVTGTLGYLDTEIDRWMKPELPKAQLATTPEKTLQTAFDYLNTVAPEASNWLIQLLWLGVHDVCLLPLDYFGLLRPGRTKQTTVFSRRICIAARHYTRWPARRHADCAGFA